MFEFVYCDLPGSIIIHQIVDKYQNKKNHDVDLIVQLLPLLCVPQSTHCCTGMGEKYGVFNKLSCWSDLDWLIYIHTVAEVPVL